MKKRISLSFFVGLFAFTFAFIGAFLGSRSRAYAIPAFARQLNVSCEQCHTVWPRLNAFGRQFKVKGYVDRSRTPGFPIAARAMATYEVDTTTPAGGPTTSSSTLSFPSQVNIFVGTALSPQVGIFSAFTFAPGTNAAGQTVWTASVDEQKYAFNFLKGKAASVVAFHSTIFGFDPFPSLGNLAFEGDYSLSPGIMNNGELLNPFNTSGFGLVVHGFLDKKNHFYGGIGVETGGAVPDTLGLGIGANDTSHEGLDFVARLAYTDDIGDGTWNIGGAYYTGTQTPTIQLPTDGSLFAYRGNVSRFFVDGALQLPVGENELFELIALYGTGTDSNYFTPDAVAGVDGPFSTSVSGGFAQASYYWTTGIGQVGVRATYDNWTLGGLTTNQWQAGPVWLPLKDFKINVNAGPMSDNMGNTTTMYQLILTKMF